MIPVSYNIRSLAVRKTSTIAALIGIALVVIIFSGSSMLNAGIRRTLGNSGRAENAIITRFGSDNELSSGIESSRVSTVISNPEFVARDKQGNYLGVGEVVIVIAADLVHQKGQFTNVVVRGTPANVWDFRDEVHIVKGRKPTPGTDEVAIGKNVPGRFRNIELDSTFELRTKRPAKVVGIFDAGGSAFDSEIWGDIDALRQAFRREGYVSSVRVRLTSPAKLASFKTYVESDKTMGLAVEREDKFYEKQSEGMTLFFGVMGGLFAFFCCLGAIIGAMITMYAQVQNRAKEIGTLKALGFSRGQILLSFLLESVLLAVGGAAVGTVLSFALGLIKFPTMNMMTWSEVTVTFDPNLPTIMSAFVFAAVMGILGGFFPAWRASKLSAIEAMRN
jgi:putative ABC transport system permease protein